MGQPVEQPDPDAPPGAASPKYVRPTRLVRGGVLALLAGSVLFCLMAYEYQWRLSVIVGSVATLVAAFGLLDITGAFDDPADTVRDRVPVARVLPHLGEVVAALASLTSVLTLAVAGVFPAPILTAAILVPATFLWLIAALFRTARSLGAFNDPEGDDAPLHRRFGFWLIALVSLIYLPMLGSYSLSDPWETHYGEVAREMLARDDWISLWWAQDGWFWSKPIFDFWAQGLFFSALGVKYQPDEIIRAIADGRFPQPEWAARMPIFLVTLAGVYFLYRVTARVHGKRTGFIAGLVLSTMPYWFLISHQTMTDMPYVGTLTAGMCLLLMGFITGPDERVAVYEIGLGSRSLRVSLYHLLFGGIILCVLPQIIYLASLNFTLHLSEGLYGFRFHGDEFSAGSGMGNCGLPGNRACSPEEPRSPDYEPIYGAIGWAILLAVLLWQNRGERRKARLCFIAGWLFVSLAAMAKGAPGLAIPVATVGAFVLATKRWRDLERAELGTFLFVFACVVLPWYVQMFVRHGNPFLERLIMHDMYKRAFVHVHDTNQGDDVSFRYYVWQLGYGLFPWTGLSAAGLVAWLRRRDHTPDHRGDLGTFMILWFVSAFGMFTITLTKFHHYIFPLVPPAAVLTGVLFDRLVGSSSPARPGRLPHYLATLSTGVLLLIYGIIRMFPRTLLGLELEEPPRALAYGCLGVGAALSVGAVFAFGRRRDAAAVSDTNSNLHENAMLGFVGIVSAVVLLLVGRDLVTSSQGDLPGSIRLMQLFTYNYRRPWPESLDFTGAFWAFTAVAAVASALLIFPRLRRHAAVAVLVTATLFSVWGLDVYLVQASPHWGQRETILAYYEHRKSADEPIVAFQMNWKGENFYTGNRVPAFVSSGKKFKDWIAEQKERGVTVMFFTTEHTRIGSLKRELGDVEKFEKLTDKELNNKFFLARVVL